MITLSFSFAHHGKFSSYHRLLEYLEPADEAVDASLPAWCYRRWFNPRGIPVRAWRRSREARAWRLARRDGHRGVHYLYPEQEYFRGSSLRDEGQKILFSCHLPEQKLEQVKHTLGPFMGGLKHADGIILVSPTDLEYYRSLAPQARIGFIPHGIDIHYFRPAGKRPGGGSPPRTTLTVGRMMRDFDLLAGVIRLAAERRANIRFRVVAPEQNLRELLDSCGSPGRDLVEPHCGISDGELLHLYQSSDLLFLPLLDATANNALLEAMATGLPILVTDLPACRAYAEDCAKYLPAGQEPPDVLARIEKLAGDRTRLEHMATTSRRHAEEHLSWEAISARHGEFIRALDDR